MRGRGCRRVAGVRQPHRARGRRGGRGGQWRRQWEVGHCRSRPNGAGGAVSGARPHSPLPCAPSHLQRRHRGRGGRLEQARSQVGRGGAEGRGRAGQWRRGRGRGPCAAGRHSRPVYPPTSGQPGRRSGAERCRRVLGQGRQRGMGDLRQRSTWGRRGDRGGHRRRQWGVGRPRRQEKIRTGGVVSGARPGDRRPCAPHPQRRLHRGLSGRRQRARRQVRRGGAGRRREGGRADRARGQKGGARAVGVCHSGGARSCSGRSGPAGGQGRERRSSCRRAARRRGRGGTTAAGDRTGSRPTVARRGAARRRGAGAREGSPHAAGVGRVAADDGGPVRSRSGRLGGGAGQRGSEAAAPGRGGGPVDLPRPRGPARRAGGSSGR